MRIGTISFLMTTLLWVDAFPQSWWKPSPKDHLSWQWQILTPPTPAEILNVDMYDVDLFDTPKATIDSLKKQGTKVTCYFSAGTYEGWRSDWSQFFPFITGADYQGTEKPFLGKMADWNERWLDVREIDLLKPIMTARIKLAKSKGCDAVEPDNMDSYSNLAEVKPVGAYTAADQIAYNKAVAGWAHAEGLSVALKNDVAQLPDLVNDFDWALNEQCYAFNECGGYTVFTQAGKAVFGVEYAGDTATFCPKARAAGMSWLKKNLDLGPYRAACNDGRSVGAAVMPRSMERKTRAGDFANGAAATSTWNGLGRDLPMSKQGSTVTYK